MTVPEIGKHSISIHIMNLEYFLKSVFQYEFTLNIRNVHSLLMFTQYRRNQYYSGLHIIVHTMASEIL